MTLSKDLPTFQTVPRVQRLDGIAAQQPKTTDILPPSRFSRQYSDIQLPGNLGLIRSQVPLAPMTSLRVGGPAEWYLDSHSMEDLQAGFDWARSEGLPITVLGSGSNLLISDRGLPGLVIVTRRLRDSHLDRETGRVTVGAGVSLVRLAWQAASHGLRGLEWAVGIPGTVGGAVVMNAGAHGSCTANVLVEAHVLLPDGTSAVWGPEELQYGYRTSKLQQGQYFVTQAVFQLQPGDDPKAVRADTAIDLKQRQASQPYDHPSCGSVFRNPTPQSAGHLIESTGLKGYQIGQAQVSQLHANFILNCGGATATDVFKLIRTVQRRVQQRWEIQLKPEVKILGQFY